MPEPLPLDDLLASLRDQGLPVGVREHLVVGRLLARWDDTDAASLRGALGAILGRNPDEVRIVHETFDQLYSAPPAGTEQPRLPQESAKPRRRRLHRGWIAGMTVAVLVLAMIVGELLRPQKVPDLADTSSQQDTSAPAEPSKFPDLPTRPDWQRSFSAAAGVATVLFLWLFGARLRREARQRARRRLVEAADALPGPHRYEISLADLAPPFSR
ncbi:MAG TPA: hypothetical protein VEW48_14760, partial [Thermoanaerobaculia bacterium]|nr:hypothetical protein [Thermoanaerobaculia bacterium]